MIATIAALVLSGTGIGAASLPPTDLPQLFESACLDGQAKLAPGAAAPASFDALPREVRDDLGTPTSAQVWQLNGDGRSFLYVLDFPASSKLSPRICGVASDRMDYRSAADAVEMRVTGEVHPRTTPAVQWLSVKGGYNALATRAGDFSVLQINWLSDAQRAEAMKAYQQNIP